MRVRLTQIDGKIPNLALMKLAHFYRTNGAEVHFSRAARRDMFEPEYDLVLASQVFEHSARKADELRRNFPDAVIRGTGTGDFETVEDFIGASEYEFYDYSIYPEFAPSMGFTQRGCRLKCSFCVMPKKEGKVKGVNSIGDIYREGQTYYDAESKTQKECPKQIYLLDNDFFGQPLWKDRADEIIQGGFEVCFSQGINVRLIHEEGATYLARMKYRDDSFKTKRIYTAWDNRRDENIFFKGINTLLDAGVKPGHVMVYMLCGYWPGETFEDVYYRFQRMKDAGLKPYPMVYGENKQMKRFQRWVIRRYHEFIPWEQYGKRPESECELFTAA